MGATQASATNCSQRINAVPPAYEFESAEPLARGIPEAKGYASSGCGDQPALRRELKPEPSVDIPGHSPFGANSLSQASAAYQPTLLQIRVVPVDWRTSGKVMRELAEIGQFRFSTPSVGKTNFRFHPRLHRGSSRLRAAAESKRLRSWPKDVPILVDH